MSSFLTKNITGNIAKLILGATLVIAVPTTLSACSTVGNTVGKIIPGGNSSKTVKSSTKKRKTAAPRMGVNQFLWRASLETLNFMPLSDVDPFGGVIITDWYASPQVPDERFKANIYILDTNLRADALKVSVFKQVRSPAGWNDASVDADTARSIENSILTRARQLYIATVDE